MWDSIDFNWWEGLTMATRLERLRFGDFLVERRVISEAQLLDALAEHWRSGCRIGESVVQRGYVGAAEMERLAREFENLDTIYV
jgi:hypothetical protein